MSPEQSRAARGWLGWSQTDLAKTAGVSLSTVKDFERGERSPMHQNLEAIRRAIETGGVKLLFDSAGKAVGVAIAGEPPGA